MKKNQDEMLSETVCPPLMIQTSRFMFRRGAALPHAVSLTLCGGFGFSSDAQLFPAVTFLRNQNFSLNHVHVSRTAALIFHLNKSEPQLGAARARRAQRAQRRGGRSAEQQPLHAPAPWKSQRILKLIQRIILRISS